MHPVLIALVLLAQAEDHDKPPSGLFHEDGYRAERYVDRKGELTAEERERVNTIIGWGNQITAAKSETFRLSAAHTLARIAQGHGEKAHTLTDVELKELRAEVLKLLKSKIDRMRWYGATASQYLADKDALKSLLELLRDRQPEIRQAALEALEVMADESCIDPLVAAIKSKGRNSMHLPYEPYRMIQKAVNALVTIGTPAAERALASMEEGTRDARFKEMLRIALDKVASKRAVE